MKTHNLNFEWEPVVVREVSFGIFAIRTLLYTVY